MIGRVEESLTDSLLVGERGEDEGAARFKVIDGLSNVVASETTVHLSKYTQVVMIAQQWHLNTPI